MAQKKAKATELSVFKGREAKLNRAIITMLEVKQPQTTRQIAKKVTSTREFKGKSLSTVNKRVRDLEQQGILSKTQVRERIGGVTNYYQLTPKAYLARFLGSYSIDELFQNISNQSALNILAALVSAKEEQ